MVTLTRTQDTELLQYFLTEVLRTDENHDIRRAFRALGIQNFSDLLASDETLSFSDPFDSDEQDDAGRPIQRYLPLAQAQRCKHLRNFIACVISEYDEVPTVMEWRNKVTHATYMVYCANPRVPQQVSTTRIAASTATTNTSLVASFS